MILTQVSLNARRQGARKLLGSPEAMHAAILSGFPPSVDPGRPLWRVDDDDPLRPTLFVLSQERPDLTHLEEQGGWPDHPTAHSAPYGPLLDQLVVGQQWAFRLTANPAHRATINGRKRIVAHVTAAQQTNWLLERADAIGVALTSSDGEPSFTVTDRRVLRFRRKDQTVTLGVARFEGLLKVVDASLFREALTAGIGRAKAYGCGLLTLARP